MRPRLRYFLPVLAPFLLSGCFLQVRELRSENRMLQARVDQLTQDLQSEQATSPAGELDAARQQLRAQDATIATLRMRLSDLERQSAAPPEEPIATMNPKDSQSEAARSLAQLRADQERAERLADTVAERDREVARLTVDLRDAEAERVALLNEISSIRETEGKRIAALETELAASRVEAQATQGSSTAAIERAKVLDAELKSAREQLATAEKELAAQIAKTEAETAARPKSAVEPARLARINQSAREVLGAFVTRGEADVRSTETAVIITVQADAVFQPASTKISDSGLKIFQSLKDVLTASQAPAIRVIGHSDDQPLGKGFSQFTDNWGLAAARAIAVVRWFATQPGLDGKQFYAVSRSFVEPLASNSDANGRRQNRRVEIVLDFASQK